jgi:chloramphenicol 3-O-phosphotransferase
MIPIRLMSIASSLAFRTSRTDALTEPLQNQVSNLKIVLDDHMSVAADAAISRVQHLSLAASRFEATDQLLTFFKTGLPRRQCRKTGRIVSMITEDNEKRHRSQLLDLVVRIARRTCAGLDEHESLRYLRIDERRCEGK